MVTLHYIIATGVSLKGSGQGEEKVEGTPRRLEGDRAVDRTREKEGKGLYM